MAIAVTVSHSFTSSIPDDPDSLNAGEVTPSRWNGTSAHTALITGLGYFADGTDAANLTGTLASARLPDILTAGGPTGSSTVVPVLTFDAKGRLTAVTTASIAPAVGSITGLGSGVATALGNNAGGTGGFALVGSTPPTGSAGGDLTGSYPNPTFAWIARVSGKSLTLNNTLTFAGTDSTTMTFPSTSATIARTDAGQTFTGSQVVSGGSISASAPVIDLTQTWNNSGVAFTGIKLNVTNTASSASSLLLDLQLGGSTLFNVTRAGGAVAVSSITGGFFISSTASGAYRSGSSFISSEAAASWTLGLAAAASPVAQTLQSQGSRAGTDSDVGGGNLTIRPGNGTGVGALSSLILQSPIAVASGTGAQTQTTGLTIKGGQAVLPSYTVATLPTGIKGGMAAVTDGDAGLAWGATVINSGAGATYYQVNYNGANWTVVGK